MRRQRATADLPGACAAVLTSRVLDDEGRARLDAIGLALREKSLSPRLVLPALTLKRRTAFLRLIWAAMIKSPWPGGERRGDRYVKVAGPSFEPLIVAQSAYPSLEAVLVDTPRAADAESFLIKPVETRLAWDEQAGALVAA
jgi:hypothetical protein